MEASSYSDVNTTGDKSIQPAQQNGAYPGPPSAQYDAEQQPQSLKSVTVVPSLVVTSRAHKPNNFLGLSIFNLLCCFWPLGLVALIFSIQVDLTWSSGDVKSARRYSRIAKRFNISSLVAGISIMVTVVIITMVTQITN